MASKEDVFSNISEIKKLEEEIAEFQILERVIKAQN
jgi:hypothetical protein